MTTLFRAKISLQGAPPLYEPANLTRVLDVLDAHGVTPQKWGRDERAMKRFSRAEVLAELSDPPHAFDQFEIYLSSAKKPLAYKLPLPLWGRAYLGLSFEPTPPPETWARIFALGDALVESTQPDWGATGIVFDLRDDVRRPVATDDERDAREMTGAIGLYPVDYDRGGPIGLAPRTYIGPFFVEQFGRERIESLPLVVEKLAWGGYRVDLVAEPWAAETAALLAAWRLGMAHLRGAEIFAGLDEIRRRTAGPKARLRGYER